MFGLFIYTRPTVFLSPRLTYLRCKVSIQKGWLYSGSFPFFFPHPTSLFGKYENGASIWSGDCDTSACNVHFEIWGSPFFCFLPTSFRSTYFRVRRSVDFSSWSLFLINLSRVFFLSIWYSQLPPVVHAFRPPLVWRPFPYWNDLISEPIFFLSPNSPVGLLPNPLLRETHGVNNVLVFCCLEVKQSFVFLELVWFSIAFRFLFLLPSIPPPKS